MDGFTRLKREALASDCDDLRMEAHEVHLDRRRILVPSRLVRKPIGVKGGVELTIDAREEIVAWPPGPRFGASWSG